MGLIRKGLVAAGYGIAAAAILVAGYEVLPAWAAGMWSNWSIVAGSSYCSAIVGSSNVQSGTTGQGTGTTVGVNGVYCAQTVPAGPPSLTGAEVVPLDTRLAGSPQQSALLTMQELGIGYTYTQLNLTGQTLAIPNTTSIFVLDPTGTVGSITLTLPQSPLDGQFVRISSTQTLTALIVSSGAQGATVKNSPTALTVSGAGLTAPIDYEFMYSAGNNVWYRLQ